VTINSIPWTIEILDTAGQEEYRSLWADSSAIHGDAFILTYSIASRASFLSLPGLLHTIRKAKHENENPTEHLTPENTPFPFVIAANKCDLEDQRQVSAPEGRELAKRGGGMFVECSAKNGINVMPLFTTLIQNIAELRAAEKVHQRDPRNRRIPFHRNIGLLHARPISSGIEFEEKQAARASAGKELAIDRRCSQSVGGLGRNARTSQEEVEGGCCCIVS